MPTADGAGLGLEPRLPGPYLHSLSFCLILMTTLPIFSGIQSYRIYPVLPYLTLLTSLLAGEKTKDQRGSTFCLSPQPILYDPVPMVIATGHHCPSPAWSLWVLLGVGFSSQLCRAGLLAPWAPASDSRALCNSALTQVSGLHIRQGCWL